MHLGEDATEEDGELISNLFGAVGKVWKLDEKLSDAAGTIRYMSSSRQQTDLLMLTFIICTNEFKMTFTID